MIGRESESTPQGKLGNIGGSGVSGQMIWVITIATFFGTLVAVVFVFFIFSRRDQIREALRKPEQRRVESRTPARVGAELCSPDEPFVNEITLTENVSRRGACVVTKRRWQPNDRVMVKLVRGNLRSLARIAYCKPLRGDAFAVGLQFSSAVDSSMGPPWVS